MNRAGKIVIISGLPGTGKSTLARALAERLRFVHLNTDKIRSDQNLLGQYSEKDKAGIYRILLSCTREEIQKQHNVIVDGTFYKQAFRDPFIELSKALDVQLYWIVITAPEAIVRKRVSKARPFTQADYQVYRKIRDANEPLMLPHLLLDSGHMSPGIMISAAEEYLKTHEHASS